jgi:hypothetical protein
MVMEIERVGGVQKKIAPKTFPLKYCIARGRCNFQIPEKLFVKIHSMKRTSVSLAEVSQKGWRVAGCSENASL